MFVLAEHAAEAVTSMDVQVGESVRIADRLGQRREWSGVGDALARPAGTISQVRDFMSGAAPGRRRRRGRTTATRSSRPPQHTPTRTELVAVPEEHQPPVGHVQAAAQPSRET
jgi:hypothetical protein